MKNKKLFYILMFLPLVSSIVALLFLPDLIPAHYNIENKVDRWGSKYEILIFPVVTILFGQFLLLMGRIAKKQESQGNNNEKNSLIIGICSLIIFNIISGVMIYSSLNKVDKLTFGTFKFEQILFFFVGIIFIIIGNFMPKLKKNSVLGFRTKHSMKNDEVWKKCQRFAGITNMITGAFTIILSLIFHNIKLYGLVVIVIFLELVVDLIYSHEVSKEK